MHLREKEPFKNKPILLNASNFQTLHIREVRLWTNTLELSSATYERENYLGLAFDSFLTLKDAKSMLFKAAHYWKRIVESITVTKTIYGNIWNFIQWLTFTAAMNAHNCTSTHAKTLSKSPNNNLKKNDYTHSGFTMLGFIIHNLLLVKVYISKCYWYWSCPNLDLTRSSNKKQIGSFWRICWLNGLNSI